MITLSSILMLRVRRDTASCGGEEIFILIQTIKTLLQIFGYLGREVIGKYIDPG